MAGFVLTDCFIKIGTTEFSGQATNAAISYSAEAVEITAMGDDTKKMIGGTKDWSMSFEFNGDEAITGPMFDLVGTVIPVEVRPKSGARSMTNPGYAGQALVTEYTPLDGAVGDKHTVSLSVVAHGTLERLTAATV